jgi:hypothetical protein
VQFTQPCPGFVLTFSKIGAPTHRCDVPGEASISRDLADMQYEIVDLKDIAQEYPLFIRLCNIMAE